MKYTTLNAEDMAQNELTSICAEIQKAINCGLTELTVEMTIGVKRTLTDLRGFLEYYTGGLNSTYAGGGGIKSKEYYIKAYDDVRERAIQEYAKENDGEELEDVDGYIGSFTAEEIAGSRLAWHSDNPYESWVEDMERSHSEGRVWDTDKEVTRILSNFKNEQSKSNSTYAGGGE